MLVLDAICDDYENLHQITKHLSGLSLETSEILQTLSDLIDAGLARAYRLDNTAEELPGMPSSNEVGSPCESAIGDPWFYLTEAGMKLHLCHLSDSGFDWPWDDEGVRRKGWSPPES